MSAHLLRVASHTNFSLTNGFGEEWTYALFPDSEEDATASAFAEQGMGEPLVLKPQQ